MLNLTSSLEFFLVLIHWRQCNILVGGRGLHILLHLEWIFFFFLVATFQFLKKKKKFEFECRRVISFIFISCDGMNNAELVILFAILRLFHEEHNWKLLSAIVIPQILILWLSLYLVNFNIELRYYMCVHSKMGVDNFVVLQIDEKIKV